MKRKLSYQWFGQFCLPLFAMPVVASIEVELAATSRFTDNALRTYSDPISERQDEYSAALLADYENSLLDFDTDYRASENRFDKDTQEDRSVVEGNADLLIGKQHHPVDLLLSHSRRSVLGAPDQIDLLQNEDEREIFSAVPTARLRLSRVDNILLSGDYTQIDFRYAEQFNSERKGGYLIWQHRFSPISSLEVTGQHSEISYDALPDNDYEYQNISVAYETELRQLSYLISVGYNVSKPETGDEFSSPSYRIEVDYRTGFNTLSFYINQQITDTSIGSGNRGDVGGVNLGDASGVGIDQFESQVAEIRWQNQSLCVRCSAYASLLYQKDEYQTLAEDNDQNLASIGFNYQLTRSSSLGIQASRRERRFDDVVARNDFTVTSVGVDYRYTFINDLSLRIFANLDESEADVESLTYDERVSGLSISYSF